nr:ABC transporter A family member 9-like [Tanacetum cinerariifolium]
MGVTMVVGFGYVVFASKLTLYGLNVAMGLILCHLDIRDGVVRFVLYDLTRPLVPFCSQLVHGEGLVLDQHNVFTLSYLDSLFSKGLRTVKSILPKCRLGFSRVLKGALDKEESINSTIRSWGVLGGSLQLVREALAESVSLMLDLDEDGLDLSERNLKQYIPIDHHHLIASQDVVLDRIKSFPRGKCPMMLGEYIASAPFTLLVKPGGGIRPIPFGVGVPGGGEAILHAVNRLVEDHGGVQQGDTLGPLLFSLVLHPLICKIKNSFDLCLLAWYLDDGTIIGDTLVVGKVLELIMEDGLRCGLHLHVDKTELFWPKEDPRSSLEAQLSFDMALRSTLERIVTAFGSGFGDRQWRLATLPFAFGGLGVCSAAFGSTFDDALCMFNNVMEIDFLSTPNWLHVVPISGLRQTMNGKTYRCVLCYRLGVPLFAISKPCSACSKVFMGDVFGDHALSCAGVIGIKHRQNAVCDTLVDVCFRSEISTGKEVDIGLGGGWSLPLTQTGMADFVSGRAVIDAAQCKRGKYMTKCADIGYGFLPFSFSSFGKLEKDAVTLLKQVRKFSMAQDIGACADVHIFNRISFSIVK